MLHGRQFGWFAERHVIAWLLPIGIVVLKVRTGYFVFFKLWPRLSALQLVKLCTGSKTCCAPQQGEVLSTANYQRKPQSAQSDRISDQVRPLTLDRKARASTILKPADIAWPRLVRSATCLVSQFAVGSPETDTYTLTDANTHTSKNTFT